MIKILWLFAVKIAPESTLFRFLLSALPKRKNVKLVGKLKWASAYLLIFSTLRVVKKNLFFFRLHLFFPAANSRTFKKLINKNKLYIILYLLNVIVLFSFIAVRVLD